MTKVSLSALRTRFIDAIENPSKDLDMSTLREYDYKSDGTIIYKVESKGFAASCGLTKLGSGMYSDVYAIDDKRCLKVVKSRDEGYERFVNDVVRKLPGNKYLPRIYYQGDWAGKRVYILERLSDTEDKSWRDVANEELAAAGICRNHAEYAVMHNKWYYDNQDKIKELNKRERKRLIVNNAFRQALESAIEPTPFMQVDPELVAVAKLLNQSNCHNDIHSGNVMFRGDIPVVTDPAT